VKVKLDIVTSSPENLNNLISYLPYIAVLFVVVVAAIIYFSKRRKPITYYGNDGPKNANRNPADPVIINENKIIPIDQLKSYWFCPKDKSHLQQHVVKMAQNSFFTITKNNKETGINNAISIRKIPLEAEEQTRQLIEKLFSEYSIEELTLVSTRCPNCLKFYSCPQI
jgi:hypothetical protein